MYKNMLFLLKLLFTLQVLKTRLTSLSKESIFTKKSTHNVFEKKKSSIDTSDRYVRDISLLEVTKYILRYMITAMLKTTSSSQFR